MLAACCNLGRFRAYLGNRLSSTVEDDLKRYAILYLATFLILIPLDFLFLGTIAKNFFFAQVGDMLGEVRLSAAIPFYLLYIVGVLVFVNGGRDATWSSTLVYGALFGMFCYATFELTAMSLLKHWTWPVVALDISWGAFMTAVSATLGLLITNWLAPKL
ncbi:conserved hypothetical protein [Rhodopseudomonas palustris BisB18]|uniref:DUF2177 family protein n=1 Tax=Rhodopseudomonas palustris (strain BisB18) TaxID=316056 RepID=Q211P0_RHOPB